MNLKDLETNHLPNWCPGCGNFGLWQALKQALIKLKLDPGETVIVAGIGCHGHLNNFTKVSSFEGLHGRPIPVGAGIKLANHRLKVIISTGDGDCLGEGTNHFIHAARRNHDLTVIIHDNASYSLTTGQASPTSPSSYRSKATPFGKIEEALNPISLAIAAGASFVARGFSGDLPHLTRLVKQAISHQGFAVVDVLQPCAVFNRQFTFDYYLKRVDKIKKPFKTRALAFRKSLKWSDKIPIGLFYQEKSASYEEKVGLTAKAVPIKKILRNFDWKKLTREFY
jgi:2-oxoglutarate ferredoxin oxidoreductase subunit beta